MRTFFSPFPKHAVFLFGAFFLISLLYALFSFALTDPNLVLTSWKPYWGFQQWIWHTLFQPREILTSTYVLLIIGFFSVYAVGLRMGVSNTIKSRISSKHIFLCILLASAPLLLSYNALSHDVFNYMFNAKMLSMYGANPHIHTALEFGYDDWTRFMHNTHTPAPYGYGWTLLSLLPFTVGMGKFLPTWLLFRTFSVVSLVVLWKLLNVFSYALSKKNLSFTSTWLLFANPLVLIEVISNQHNDIWMMIGAVGSLLLLVRKPKEHAVRTVFFSAVLLGLSICIKLATIVLAPIWFVAVLRWYWPALRTYITWQHLLLFASLCMFIPLFTDRSQQFLPWYLTWSFIWLPLIQHSAWRAWLIGVSLFGLLRYVPWLMAGEFTSLVLAQQKGLLWGGSLVHWISWQLWQKNKKMRYNRFQ